MKKIIFPLVLVLLIMATIVAGCANEPVAQLVPSENLSGTLENQNAAPVVPIANLVEPTVVNPIGYQVFPRNPPLAMTFSGPVFTPEQWDEMLSSNTPVANAIVYEPEMGILQTYVSIYPDYSGQNDFEADALRALLCQ